MKIFILIFIIFFVSIIVTLKLIRSPEPNRDSERLIERSDSGKYETGNYMYKDDGETNDGQVKEVGIDNRKLMAFAKAFVEVQSYMNRVGSGASYKETKKIVKKHGLSVEDYTRIATLMNENPNFRNKVQKMIDEIIPHIPL
ncbi:MAG: hypothetical protein SCARUB_01753 [Candidatus Scalindua rubra]|uniref:DUF4168 domain-containing protein n=1 Tax=Candidatus Scalindua rubra TaxID=1872076 RepID=A0A1E3XC02_9BACT|nr:MAG: hypothetical protein SCARUB_01753 [Candidatus Scalindua rubra]